MKRRDLLALIVGAAVLATAASAQQPARIGYLALLPGEDATLMKPLLNRLGQLGYRDGHNLTVEYRSAEGHPERLPQLAAELVGSHPDVLVTGFGTLTANAAKAATATIPIVFTTVGDPVGAGLVASLSHPGGNVTGLTDQAADIGGKRLQLLQEVVPGGTAFAVLMNPNTPYSALALKEIQVAAEAKRVRIIAFEARTAEEVLRRFAEIADSGVAGVLVLGDPLMISLRGQIADLAVEHRLPSIYQFRESVEAGGLMSYGPDRRQVYARAAEYVEKVLKGAKPADLPVEQPTKFELVINLKTATALGLSVPPILFAQADEVIE
jgi:putative tryptophan/tyrosine transport system substrate-binding protein